jgi:hypothetical protein
MEVFRREHLTRSRSAEAIKPPRWPARAMSGLIWTSAAGPRAPDELAEPEDRKRSSESARTGSRIRFAGIVARLVWDRAGDGRLRRDHRDLRHRRWRAGREPGGRGGRRAGQTEATQATTRPPRLALPRARPHGTCRRERPSAASSSGPQTSSSDLRRFDSSKLDVLLGHFARSTRLLGMRGMRGTKDGARPRSHHSIHCRHRCCSAGRRRAFVSSGASRSLAGRSRKPTSWSRLPVAGAKARCAQEAASAGYPPRIGTCCRSPRSRNVAVLGELRCAARSRLARVACAILGSRCRARTRRTARDPRLLVGVLLQLVGR